MSTSINVHRVVSVEIERIEYSNFHELRIAGLDENGAEVAVIGFLSGDKIPPSIRELKPRKASESSNSTQPNQE